MYRLLTLAMTETRPNKDEYKIIVYCIDDEQIYGFDIKQYDLIDINGDPVWDIGAVTLVENMKLRSSYSKNKTYEPVGDMILKEYYNKQQLKSIFKQETLNYSVFKRNNSIEYSVIKVDRLIKISEPLIDSRGVFRTYIDFWSNGCEEKQIMNKDYRWLNYWKYAYKSNNSKEKILYYEKLFKKSGKDIYLIMYRHRYLEKRKNSMQNFGNTIKITTWIAGFHYL